MNTPDERVFGERREPSAPLSEGELRVVYHGGLAERFGVETLVRAVALLRGRGHPIHLDVYGSDAEAARQLAALAAEVAPDGRYGSPRSRPRSRRSRPASKKPTSASSPPCATTSPSCCCRSSCSSTCTWACRWSPRGCR